MNIDGQDHYHDPIREDDEALRLGLRELRRDLAPARDLWPGVAAAIAVPVDAGVRRTPSHPSRTLVEPAAADCASASWRASRGRRLHRLLTPLALAASLVLVLGLGLRLQPATDPATPLLRGEAVAMSHEYRAALASLERSPVQPEMRGALDELDRSATQILAALQQHPQPRFLFDQLRRTYARRLELTQRAIIP